MALGNWFSQEPKCGSLDLKHLICVYFDNIVLQFNVKKSIDNFIFNF